MGHRGPVRQLFVELESIARKLGLQINQEKSKYLTVERKSDFNQNNIGPLKIKKYTFERVESFKYLGVILMKTTITEHTYKKE
jgi:hypothetical protein